VKDTQRLASMSRVETVHTRDDYLPPSGRTYRIPRAGLRHYGAPVHPRLKPLEFHPVYVYCTAMEKLRIVASGVWGGRSLTKPFRDARRFSSTRL
jgi:hypothetical protein